MKVFLAEPRGFCAGVRHALEIVEQTLKQYGAPIFVRHEIVHNRHVINGLKQRGVIFINELDEMTDISRPVIFSAHGVSQEVKNCADNRRLITVDAICPLVESVHKRIKMLEEQNIEIIVIGNATHPEIIGTVGQLKHPERAHIISEISDIDNLSLAPDTTIGIVTQTTLAVDDTQKIMHRLQQKFRHIVNISGVNVCYATTNRQKAVRHLVKLTPNIIIIGSKNSSNSKHLKETALHFGAQKAWLIDDASELPLSELENCDSVGISAGASAPEYLVEGLLDFLQRRYDNINIQNVIVTAENISFK